MANGRRQDIRFDQRFDHHKSHKPLKPPTFQRLMASVRSIPLPPPEPGSTRSSGALVTAPSETTTEPHAIRSYRLDTRWWRSSSTAPQEASRRNNLEGRRVEKADRRIPTRQKRPSPYSRSLHIEYAIARRRCAAVAAPRLPRSMPHAPTFAPHSRGRTTATLNCRRSCRSCASWMSAASCCRSPTRAMHTSMRC